MIIEQKKLNYHRLQKKLAEICNTVENLRKKERPNHNTTEL